MVRAPPGGPRAWDRRRAHARRSAQCCLPRPRSARDRVVHRRLPHRRPGDRSRPPRTARREGRRAPAAAAVRGGSRAVRPRAGGLAERAARRARRRRPRSRALLNGRAQGPPKHKLGMARRSLDTRLRTRVAARVQSIGLRPRPWRSAAEAPRSACCASHARGVSMPTTYLKSTGIPLLCAPSRVGAGRPPRKSSAPHMTMSQHHTEPAIDAALKDRVLTDGDVEAIAEATAARLAGDRQRRTPANVRAGRRTTARARPGRIARLRVRARDRARRHASWLWAQGTHPLRSRPRAPGA